MSMSEFHRQILEKSRPTLLNDLDATDVVPHLVGDQVLTRHDEEKIMCKATRRDKVSELMDIIPRRGMSAYTSFLNSLIATEGSKHLYQYVKDLEEMSAAAIQDDDDVQFPLTTECQDSISVRMGNEEAATLRPGFPVCQPSDARRPRHPELVLNDLQLLELAKGLGEHWETLGLYLGFNKATIYQCKANNVLSVVQQTFDMLNKWKCKNGRAATTSALLEACKKIDLLSEDVYAFLYDL